MSLGEIVLLLLVGIIVVGPRNLPAMMRTAGQWVARLRRMSTELRTQSGIDDLLQREGLDEHLHQLRSLSRLNVMETLMAPAARAAAGTPVASVTARTPALYPSAQAMEWRRDEPLREREYPLIGCDACGALPDDATPYHPAALAETATDETATLPVDPSPTPPAEAAAGEPASVNEPAAIEAPT